MKAKKIKDNIYWVGAIDFDIRAFHGYKIPRGSSYNSYLLIDEKITLIDTVRDYKFDEMLSRIKSVINPEKIDYIIVNHVEMVHSGSLEKILEIAKNAKIISNKMGLSGLKKHYFNLENINIDFIQIPMAHWPESMATINKRRKNNFSK